MELYQKLRRAVLVDKMSRRGAARYFGIDRKTVDKMLVFAAPPPHRRKGRVFSRKLEGLTDFIDQIVPATAPFIAQAAAHGGSDL